MRIFATIAALGLAACASIPVTATKDSKLEAKAKTDIRNYLRDPASGQFNNFRSYSLGNGEKAVCAYVNSRNGFGGMTGFQDVVVIYQPGGRHLIFEGGPALNECNGMARGMTIR